MQHSDTVIAVSFSDTEQEVSHKEAQGTFYLIKKTLQDQPQKNWPDTITSLQVHFGIPLALMEVTDLEDSFSKLMQDEDISRRFNSGKIIYLQDSLQIYYIGRIEGSSFVLQAGPVEPPIKALIYFASGFLALFILGLAVALFLWIRPLWLSMNELSRSAEDFGEGKLDARAHVKPRAALGTLAGQFNAMAEKIDRLVSGQRELTNAVSHELRTPIARMRFGLEMLSQTVQKSGQRHLIGLNADVDDLDSLVNELLHYARFEQIDSLPDIENIDIAQWLENIIENARGYAGDVSITFNNKLETSLNTQCSPHYSARVIHNLLRNACRYSQHEINVTLKVKENEIIIHVDDDGIGIPEQDRHRVFEPFSRLDESRNRSSGGHGLGLAIAKRIINAHKGNIVINDSPLGGARFTINWPKL